MPQPPALSPGFLHRLLLRMDPERAHDAVIAALRFSSRSGVGLRQIRRRFLHESSRLEQTVLGLRFANPVGLAAGFDKNAQAAQGLAALGFGFVEVGTVTPRPQGGNPKPRIFRHRGRQSLQNALGFNNDGMDAVWSRVASGRPHAFPLGVNVGKNAATPLDRADGDYEQLFRRFAGCADYFVINISSPNTPGLRDLQSPDRIEALLARARRLTDRAVFVKLSPDLKRSRAVELARSAVGAGAAGVIVSNTTVDYSLIPGVGEFGGLSGGVLRDRSFDMLRALAGELFGKTVLISVGGIDSGDEVYRRLRAGASLVQIYTALVYQGPGLVGSVLARLEELMKRDGFDKLSALVGADLEVG